MQRQLEATNAAKEALATAKKEAAEATQSLEEARGELAKYEGALKEMYDEVGLPQLLCMRENVMRNDYVEKVTLRRRALKNLIAVYAEMMEVGKVQISEYETLREEAKGLADKAKGKQLLVAVPPVDFAATGDVLPENTKASVRAWYVRKFKDVENIDLGEDAAAE